ncbi:MAG: DUF4145 domain-containing protein, partial [Deltaproteobacteria bacterium]|nr:DUF4145 domain-containing protein [Deltaproteobacteria bacterium]
PPDERPEEILGGFTAVFVKAKQQPQRELTPELVQELQPLLERDLDRYFTILALRETPQIVERWKKLRALDYVVMPGKNVRGLIWQAVNCYLYGLPSAAPVLCRSVPELALKESFVAREGPILPGTLEGLVEFARRSKALPNALATKADRIRVLGNKAVHRGGCS